MKVKLLKAIRSDLRFHIYKAHDVKGYKDSGWWYLKDQKLDLKMRSKKLKVVLKEYLRIVEMKNRIKRYKLTIAACIIIMTVLLTCSCKEERVEIWDAKSVDSAVDSSIYFQNILDSLQNK